MKATIVATCNICQQSQHLADYTNSKWQWRDGVTLSDFEDKHAHVTQTQCTCDDEEKDCCECFDPIINVTTKIVDDSGKSYSTLNMQFAEYDNATGDTIASDTYTVNGREGHQCNNATIAAFYS